MTTATLFEVDAPNYASTTFPEPRPFQDTAHESLREGARQGHRCQMVMAPTGAGKSYLGLRIIHEALARGRRGIFVCDRTTLINQTSQAADRYGLSAHSVLQASHWRFDPSMPFQIASAQTIARRQWPDADVIVIDEAHTQLSVWTDHIQTCRAKVVGLSATPFSPGLGKLFSRLVNATTMHDLTQSGVLVPMRVLSCTRIDMRGAETAGGEWTDDAAAERGMGIVGDVVSEWVKHGEGRKTICFGATIAHCEELCRQFNESGVMAATFTSDTLPPEREALLKEFKKPDSVLRVLISVEALAKGFDDPTVSCVIDCRPLRKSLSTAIQMWGRGLRCSPETQKKDCLARGTLVLTDKGEIEIQHVTLDHKVWDGENFVQHSGAVCRGVQRVISYDGLIATPDHEVWTNDGWTRIETAAHRGLRIARTGLGGGPIRLADDRVAGNAREWLQPASGSAVREMRRDALRAVPQHPQATGDCGLPALQWKAAGVGAGLVVPTMPSAVAALHESAFCVVRAVRWAWNQVSVFFSQRGGALGCREPGRTRSVDAIGSQGQQRALRAGELVLVNSRGEPEQHQGIGREAAFHSFSQGAPGNPVCGHDAGAAHQSRADGRADRGAVGDAFSEAEREVWDVLNAGPLQRFTANGRLVHNCILLDHSGNVVRFREDFEDIYFNGLSELDTGEKLDKAVRKDKDEDEEHKGCPACGHKPFAKRCMSCGFTVQTAALVEAQQGEMREVVMLGGKKMGDDKAHVWAQVAAYARCHSTPVNQQGRAWNLYHQITGQKAPNSWKVETTPGVEITRPVLNKIKALNIAYAKSRQKVAA